MDTIEIPPCREPINTAVQPPGSKSITNRALVCAALAGGPSTLDGVLDSEDTQVMIAGLQSLGFDIERNLENASLQITGHGGTIPAADADIYIANSGTTVRFLTAMLAHGHGRYRLHGTPRMHERPIGDLVDALKQLGVDLETESPNHCPPVVIRTKGLSSGETTVAGNISSQYLSALLMTAPAAGGDIEIKVEGELVSKPYITMTLAVMRAFGAEVEAADDLTYFRIPAASSYRGTRYTIEPDASAASYFFAAAAVTGGRITVSNLSDKSLQGDTRFCDCLEMMGCDVQYGENSITVTGCPQLRGIDVDMNAISDTAQTLAVVALFADGPTRITNIAHVRHKETDRIAAVATELRKLGAEVEEREDGLTITPPTSLTPAEIDTYDDHRMAMSFAIAGLKVEGVVIRDPGCTAKTYPNFFDDLKRLVQ